MKKAYLFIGIAVFVCLILAAVIVTVCLKHKNNAQESWKDMGFDLSLPTLGEDGWYMVFEDDFEGDTLNQNIQFGERYAGTKEIWTTSPARRSLGKQRQKQAGTGLLVVPGNGRG